MGLRFISVPFSSPTEASDKMIRNLNGRIDEFIIFDRELDAREVGAIYEVGKPTS